MSTAAEWIGAAGVALTLIGIMVRMERRMGKALTREEHEQICKERNDRVEKKFDDLRRDSDHRHQENRETLSEIRDSITGTHRRLDAFIMRGRDGS